jgi:UDP-glucuronate 4-epimerase
MNIWITGCAGFLGKRLARAFTSSGANVVGFSRRTSECEGHHVVVDLADVKAIELIRQTVVSRGVPDVLIHAASKQPGVGELADFVRANIQTTFNLMEGLKESPPKQVIYTSTLSVYAPGVSLPVSETAPPVAAGSYPATKRWAEEVMQCWTGSQVTVLRLPSLYGLGQADSFIDGLARLALRGEPIELFSGGELIRDTLHVSDVVTAISQCINQRPSVQFCLLNLGCGRAISTMEYATALVAELESSSEVVRSDRRASQPNLWADISLAQCTIGFKPKQLRESMKTYGDELRA